MTRELGDSVVCLVNTNQDKVIIQINVAEKLVADGKYRRQYDKRSGIFDRWRWRRSGRLCHCRWEERRVDDVIAMLGEVLSVL